MLRERFAKLLACAVQEQSLVTYAPSDLLYWQHGYSTERDFVYVTTANLTHAQLEQLSDDVGPDRTLLVLCTAFRGKAERYLNLTVKKIPKQVLASPGSAPPSTVACVRFSTQLVPPWRAP